MVRAMQKRVFGRMRIANAKIRLRISDQGRRYPRTESFDTQSVFMNGEQSPG